MPAEQMFPAPVKGEYSLLSVLLGFYAWVLGPEKSGSRPVSSGSKANKDSQFTHIPGLSISLPVAVLIPYQMLALWFQRVNELRVTLCFQNY